MKSRRRVKMGVRGSITIESVVAFPFACMCLLLMAMLLRDIGYKDQLSQQLHGYGEQISRSHIQSEGELWGVSVVAAPLLGTAIPGQVRLESATLRSDGSYQIAMKWTRALPIVGDVQTRVHTVGRVLYLGNRSLAQGEDALVYVTSTGQKYHLMGCQHLAKSATAILKSEALKQGYEPCWHCVGGLKPFEPAPKGVDADP